MATSGPRVLLWHALSNFTEVKLEGEPRRKQVRGAREVTSLVQTQTRLNAAASAELVAAYLAGGTVKGVARQFGVHHDTARRILDDAKVPRRKRVPLTKNDVVEAVRLYESGLTILQVAEQFDQKYQSMRQALLRAGVVMRPPVAER